ncbi:unnamed protein product [Clonostachys rosea]|uniref:RNB domain-containing protein n=1 Tax=Bionectria ochroleuca TaxID=29856 RepID=A0ABY6U9M1_BIOOC|nr:unnamed protein product [Clonostachys rosea]
MLQSYKPSNACLRCVYRGSHHGATLVARRVSPLKVRLNTSVLAHYSTAITVADNPKKFGPSHFPDQSQPGKHDEKPVTKTKPLSIRVRLAAWNSMSENQNVILNPIHDKLDFTKSPNGLVRSQSTGAAELESFKASRAGMTAIIDDDWVGTSLLEVGLDSRQPGDLVEIRYQASRAPVMGVYLGFAGGRHHFYSASGRWTMTVGFGSFFTVSHFASPGELEPILAAIPDCKTPDEFDLARQDGEGPSRADASVLIDKMNNFMMDAQRIYQGSMDNLDKAREILADDKHVKYLSLFEIADILLPASLKENGQFPPHALYAVHTSMSRNEVAFKPLSPTSDCHRREHIFEVFPASFHRSVSRIATMVRDYSATKARTTLDPSKRKVEQTPFESFIEKARSVVLASRETRDWTPHGILAPSSVSTVLPKVEWTDVDLEIIAFLRSWASYDLFEPSSRFPGYGATILRALDLYPDVSLDQSRAWTFLQEIGSIRPWEIPSRYSVRFPKTNIMRSGGLMRKIPPMLEESRRADLAAAYRTDMKSATVFCIDGPGTIMVDDGISLERTSKDDEFWIHVHAADPASGIDPKSQLSQYLELLPENIYLRGHFQAMLSDTLGGPPRAEFAKLVREYSLANDTPALTFSAKVNSSGSILDYKIAPTRLGKVVYLDPADVSVFCGDEVVNTIKPSQFSVGLDHIRPPTPPNRTMPSPESLDALAQDDLLTLNRLAKAIHQERLAKGAWPYFFPTPTVQVIHPEKPINIDPTDDTAYTPADPFIEVKLGNDPIASVVGNTMVLAGEVAARWCADRGIPIPYRQDGKSAENYEMALQYATDELYPQIQKGIEPSMEQRAKLSVLTGGVEIAATPGPYFIMGLDMYTKATSPLRRYSDLLTHWQIHAALAHENENQLKLNGSQHDLDSILPFSKDEMTNMIALLHMREKMTRRVSRGDRDWLLIALVRAWRFEKTAPKSFRFTVSSRWKTGLVGNLDFFGLSAFCDSIGLQNKVLIKDVKVGDQLEVELTDINVHSGEIMVQALNYLGPPKTGSAE